MEAMLPQVKLNLSAKTKKDAIRELAQVFSRSKDVSDLEAFIADLEKREAIMSTYCGFNLAIPHSESEFVENASFAFGRSSGIEWDEDDEEVKFIIILAIPKMQEGEENPHIEMMSKVATLALEDDVRGIWESAQSAEEIIETFNINI